MRNVLDFIVSIILTIIFVCMIIVGIPLFGFCIMMAGIYFIFEYIVHYIKKIINKLFN